MEMSQSEIHMGKVRQQSKDMIMLKIYKEKIMNPEDIDKSKILELRPLQGIIKENSKALLEKSASP